MNLVKAQEYAESLPPAELKKYADGLNPAMLPPWLATAEIDAKAKRVEMANNLQGAAQGQKPSIKEQIEKKAGLLALQQAQMAQQQGAAAAPQPGGPVPEGTPEPDQQPQQEAGLDQLQSNIQMAGGGIVAFAGKGPSKVVNPDAGFWEWLSATSGLSKEEFIASPQKTKNAILDMFRSSESITPPPSAQAAQAAQTAQAAPSAAYKAGQKTAAALSAAKDLAKTKLLPGANVGLAAYEGLSDISDAQKFYDDPNVSMADKALQFARTGSKTALPVAGGAVGSVFAPVVGTIGGAAAGTGLAALIDKEGEALQKWRAAQAAGQKDNQSAAETARLNATAPPSDMGNEGRRTTRVGEGIGTNVSPNLIPANLRPAAKPPAAANPNAPAAPAAPAASAAPAPDSYEAMLRDALKNSPKERSVESIIAEQNAIDKALGLDVPAGKDKLERIAEIKKQYADTQKTPMQEFIAMLGQAGQSKGLSGLAPAYTGMAEQKRKSDLDMAQKINELMGGVEDTQRGEKTATKTKVSTAREKDIENARLFDREKMQTLGTARGQDVQAAVTTRGQDLQYKAAMAAAMQRGDNQEIAKINAASQLAARDETINNWQAQLKELAKMPLPSNKVKMAELERQIDARTKSIYGQFGITIPETPSATSPSGTPRMRFDAQGNQIK